MTGRSFYREREKMHGKWEEGGSENEESNEKIKKREIDR